MKRFIAPIVVGAVLFIAAPAISQTPPAQSGPGNNAVNSAGQNNASTPVAGRNSFTEGEAKSAIEKAGYASPSDLKKDDDGVLRRTMTACGAVRPPRTARRPQLASIFKATS